MKNYKLQEGVAELIKSIDALDSKSKIVTITGGSASGKTKEVTAKIKAHYGDKATVLSQDDYYIPKAVMDTWSEPNFDIPDAIELSLLLEHIKQIKNGESVDKPIYSMQLGDRDGSEVLSPNEIIIVEGLFLTSGISQEADVNVFVGASSHDRLFRRLARNVLVEGRNGRTMESELAYTLSVVLPLHDQYIEPNRELADMVINNDLIPDVEMLPKTEVNDHRVRFRVPNGFDLSQYSGELVQSIEVKESYYAKVDNDVYSQLELIKIREINGQKQLIYKVPFEDNRLIVRSRIEADMSEQMVVDFEKYYEAQVQVSVKSSYYEFDGFELVHDTVEGLGEFVQFRVSQESALGNCLVFAGELGLKLSDIVVKPYFRLFK